MNQTHLLLAELKRRGCYLAIAESLTGGGLSEAITEVSGSSQVFLGAIVAYQSALKHELLGVSAARLQTHGAVDQVVAAQMATGVRELIAKKCGIDPDLVVGVSTTGVAGPDTADGKPVGTVFAGVSSSFFDDQVLVLSLEGDREQIRQQTTSQVIAFLWEQISSLERL